MTKKEQQPTPPVTSTPPTTGKLKLDPAQLRRTKPPGNGSKPPPSPLPVSAGPVDKVVELAFNPSREKIREVTIVDRIQGRLLPQLDIIDVMWQYVLEVAAFRQNSEEYRHVFDKEQPVPPSLINEFTYRTAQWQKSIVGTNLKSAVDLALAETESRTGEEGEFEGGDAWKD